MKQYKYTLDKNTSIYELYDLNKSSEGELKEKLNNIPFNVLQPDISLKRYDSGDYYSQVYDDGSYISFVITPHSINLLSKKLVNNMYEFRAIYYEIYSNDIMVKYYENDLNQSTYNPKMYINQVVPAKEKKFYYTKEEAVPIIEELFSDIEKFDGIDKILDLKEYRENIEKYLEGIKRR